MAQKLLSKVINKLEYTGKTFLYLGKDIYTDIQTKKPKTLDKLEEIIFHQILKDLSL